MLVAHGARSADDKSHRRARAAHACGCAHGRARIRAETVLVEQLRAHTEREALKAQLGRLDAIQAQVEHLTARLATYDEGPLLPNGAFGRMQRAQRERADLRADLSPLRERYVDAPDSDDLSVSSDGASASPGK
jgi:hypothetical protein